jgi:hypothetical protein
MPVVFALEGVGTEDCGKLSVAALATATCPGPDNRQSATARAVAQRGGFMAGSLSDLRDTL